MEGSIQLKYYALAAAKPENNADDLEVVSESIGAVVVDHKDVVPDTADVENKGEELKVPTPSSEPEPVAVETPKLEPVAVATESSIESPTKESSPTEEPEEPATKVTTEPVVVPEVPIMHDEPIKHDESESVTPVKPSSVPTFSTPVCSSPPKVPCTKNDEPSSKSPQAENLEPQIPHAQADTTTSKSDGGATAVSEAEPVIQTQAPSTMAPVTPAKAFKMAAFSTPQRSPAKFNRSMMPRTPSAPKGRFDYVLPSKSEIPLKVNRATPLKQRLSDETKVRRTRESWYKTSVQSAISKQKEFQQKTFDYLSAMQAVVQETMQNERAYRREMDQIERQQRAERVAQYFVTASQTATRFEKLQQELLNRQKSDLGRRRSRESIEASERSLRVQAHRVEEQKIRAKAPKGQADEAVRAWLNKKLENERKALDAAAIKQGRIDHAALIARWAKIRKQQQVVATPEQVSTSTPLARAAVVPNDMGRSAPSPKTASFVVDQETSLLPVTPERIALRKDAPRLAKEAAKSIPQRLARQTLDRRSRETTEKQLRQKQVHDYFVEAQKKEFETQAWNNAQKQKVDSRIMEATNILRQRMVAEKKSRADRLKW